MIYQWFIENRLIMADIFGYLALFIYIFALQAQTVKRTALYSTPMDFFYALHFLMLGAVSGMYVAFMGSVRDLFVAYGSKRTLYLFIVVYISIIWCATFIVAKTGVDYIPVVASTSATIGMLFRQNFVLSRAMVYVSQILWISFFWQIMSVPGAVGASVVIISNTVALRRYLVLQEKRRVRHEAALLPATPD